jgi:hypothetical protein
MLRFVWRRRGWEM